MEKQYISVKEFAAAAGVSTQRIYQLLAKDLQSYCKSEKGKKYINIEALERFEPEDLQSTCKDLPSTCKTLAKGLQSPLAKIEELTAANEGLNNEISTLKEEVARLAKDLQKSENTIANLETERKSLDMLIQELRADKAKLNERLDREQETISDLSAALKAAQLLHGMDKQQQAIEVKEQAHPESDELTAPGDLTPEAEQKTSIFTRLFKRSKKQR